MDGVRETAPLDFFAFDPAFTGGVRLVASGGNGAGRAKQTNRLEPNQSALLSN